MKFRIIILFLIINASLCVHVVFAHTPLTPSHENESLETAYEISDPTKSWAIYGELHQGGEAQYYRFNIQKGERLRVNLFLSTSEDESFVPMLVLMGPGITSKDRLPDYIEVPNGAGILLSESKRPAQPEYEPFTPTSYYYLVDLDTNILETGNYYIAVYEDTKGGRYGLAVGYREQFTLDEWILIPINVISVHQWEGQSLIFILAPIIATVILGFVYLISRRKSIFKRTRGWTGVFAGLLYLGSGITTIIQMIYALIPAPIGFGVVLTVIFALLPILLGVAIIQQVKGFRDTKRARLWLIILGFIGFFVWAGVIVGPILSVVTGIFPRKEL
ncbi:MAG: hypothetical protein GTN80_09245 [Nitrososphaeria archaeon]|nr:hypothetical protein [Nitrososphaeria archaeon]NIQ33805.1 hypothetical protein [Nitrososphaeria archaeon]